MVEVLVARWLLALVVAGAPEIGERRAACLARNSEVAPRYREVVQAICADHHNLGGVGASVAIAEGGVLRMVATAGERCVGGSEVTADTGFRIGSLTKLWTAALVAMAVDAGEWTLDEPVVRALPELGGGVDPRAATISLRQLLSHSGGLGELRPRDAPAEGWVEAVAERPLWTEPGALWSYSNVGHALAGAALERSSGETYAALLQRRLLGPLGAVHVTADPEVALRDGAACGHLGRGARVLPLDVHDDLELGAAGARWTTAAGGLVASSGGLVDLVLGLFDPLRSPLSAAARDELLRPQIATHERPGESYALGLRVLRLEDGDLLYMHSGDTGDFAADLYFVPARGFVMVLLSNTGDPLQASAALALQVLLGVRRELPGPPGAPGAHAGSYVVEDFAAPIVVRSLGDRLVITSEDRGIDGVLEHAGDHRFRAGGSAWTFVFADGPAHASHLRGPGLVAIRDHAPR